MKIAASLAVLGLLPCIVYANVPESVARIVSINSHPEGFLSTTIMNTGSQSINAIVISCNTHLGSMDFTGPGIQPGQSTEYMGSSTDATLSNTHIVGVILGDGTMIGDPKDEVSGESIFGNIFAARQKKAVEWAKFQKFFSGLNPDDAHGSMQAFLQYAASLGNGPDPKDQRPMINAEDKEYYRVLAAREALRTEIQQLVSNMQISLQHYPLSEEDAWIKLRESVRQYLAQADYKKYAVRGATR